MFNRRWLKPKKEVSTIIQSSSSTDQTLDGSSTLIVVYTMAKVGSTTISTSIASSGIACHQVHSLELRRLKAFLQYYINSGQEIPAHLGKSIQLRRLLQGGASVKYITAIREPLGRNLSAVFQNLDRDSPDEAIWRLCEGYDAKTPDKWFDEDFRPVTDVDYRALRWPAGCTHQIHTIPSGEVLIVKLGLSDQALASLLSSYLGTEITVSRANEPEGKWYRAIYQRVRQELQIPKDFIVGSFENRYFSVFYSEEEREAVLASYAIDEKVKQLIRNRINEELVR